MYVTNTQTPSEKQALAKDSDRDSVVTMNDGVFHFSFDPEDGEAEFSIHDQSLETVWSRVSVGGVKWTELTFRDPLFGRRAKVTFFGMTKIELITAILSAPDKF